MQNIKDEIGFHNLLFSVRKHRGLSLEKLRYGIYSPAMMHYIESGERLPDYLMRNRIMDRLGISAEDYSDYVSCEEYDRYQKRAELIAAVESEQTVDARHIFDFLMDSCDTSKKVEYQFLLDMKAKIMFQEQHHIGEIAETYKQAVDLTMPEIDLNRIDDYCLSSDEYYLLVLWVQADYLAENISLDEAEWKLISILKALEKSYFQEITKCKVYPMAIVTLYNLYKKTGIIWDAAKISMIKNYIEKAVELLRKAGRLYYLIELLEIDDSLKSIDDRSRNWLEIIKNLYDEYNVHRNMDYSCYIYKSIFVINVGRVIKSRRKMIGISQKKLAEGICVPKTVERIENGQNYPQQIVLKGIMEKLGINGDYCRTDIYTNNYYLIRAYNKCIYELSRKNNNAFELFTMLIKSIDKNSSNMLELIRIINLEKIRVRKIAPERFVDNLKKALKYTKIDLDNIRNLSGYLTNCEMQCIYNIVCRGRKTKSGEKAASLLMALCEDISNEQTLSLQYSIYELIMSWYANNLGNEGNYDKSCRISERLIADSLQQQRATTIAKELYNITWNTAMQEENHNNTNYLIKLKIIESLYEYCYRSDRVMFIRNKTEKLCKNMDWTKPDL